MAKAELYPTYEDASRALKARGYVWTNDGGWYVHPTAPPMQVVHARGGSALDPRGFVIRQLKLRGPR